MVNGDGVAEPTVDGNNLIFSVSGVRRLEEGDLIGIKPFDIGHRGSIMFDLS